MLKKQTKSKAWTLLRTNTLDSVEDEHVDHFKVTNKRPSVLIHHEIEKTATICAFDIEANKSEARRKSLFAPPGQFLSLIPQSNKPVPRIMIERNSSFKPSIANSYLSRNRIPLENKDESSQNTVYSIKTEDNTLHLYNVELQTVLAYIEDDEETFQKIKNFIMQEP